MDWDIRDQVFVSSTFQDLIDERKKIMQALLELDCFPAGMEMFPAANEDAWKLITRTIERSDYYCVVLGGRYGSTDASGLSYTEHEYDLACKLGIPILAFLHKNPQQLTVAKSD